MLGRVRRRARRNHNAPRLSIPLHVTHRQLDKIQHATVVDIDNAIVGLEQLASFINFVFKVTMRFRYARIGNCDVDMAGLFEGGFQILPACCVTLDKRGALWCPVCRRVDVKDIYSGAFGGEYLNRGAANA